MKLIILTSCFPDENSSRSEKLRYRCNKLLAEGIKPVIVKTSFRFTKNTIKLENGNVDCFGRTKNNSGNKENASKPVNILRDKAEQLVRRLTPTDKDIIYLPTTSAFLTHYIKKNGKTTLNTQCFPFTTNIIGLIAKKLTKVKWIMEYRDPWVNNPFYFPENPGKINKYLEKKCIENCSNLIYFDGIQIPESYFEDKFPEFSSKIIQLGFVGFDKNKIEDIEGKDFDEFTVVYGGTFYGGHHTPENFLKALEKFIESKNEDHKKIKLYFLGSDKKYQEVVPEKIKSKVEFESWLPPEEYISYLKGADFGLYVNLDNDPLNISGKMSDYIGCRLPVICLSKEDWRSWKFVKENDVGFVADMGDIEQIKNAIEKAYSGEVEISDEVRDRFSREKNFEEYLDLLDLSTG